MTYMQLGVPLGTFLGYFLSSQFVQILLDWRYAFYVQILALTICFIFYVCYNDDQISIHNTQQEREDISSLQTIFLQNMKTFCSNSLFVLSMLTLSSLYFVFTGIQFWMTDYFNTVMLMEYNLASQSFLIILMTAPISGVYLGGQLMNNHLGNQGFRVLKIASIEIFLVCISAALIPVIDNQRIFILLIWCLLFFVGTAIPSIMGIMITSLSYEQRSSGHSLSHLFFDIFGYLPASTLYGYCQYVSEDSTSRQGMKMISYISFLSLILLLMGICKKYNHLKQIYIDLNESEFKNKLHSLSHHSHDNYEEYEKKDFSYMRMQKSNEKGKQIIIAIHTDQLEADQLSENESPLIIGIESQRIRNVYRIQSTILQISYNFSSLIGRRSLENDFFMIKNDKLQTRMKSQKSFELQLNGANHHLKCEERIQSIQQQ